jgi:hypothetical protein
MVMVADVLPRGSSYRHASGLTPAMIWTDLTENRRNVFGAMLSGEVGDYPWTIRFTLTPEDTALLSDAEYSTRTGTRLITAALRALVAEGWAEPYGTGYVRSDRGLSRADVEIARDRTVRDAERAAEAAEAVLHRRLDYRRYGTSEQKRITDARERLRAARAAVEHPLADADALRALDDAARALHAVASEVE